MTGFEPEEGTTKTRAEGGSTVLTIPRSVADSAELQSVDSTYVAPVADSAFVVVDEDSRDELRTAELVDDLADALAVPERVELEDDDGEVELSTTAIRVESSSIVITIPRSVVIDCSIDDGQRLTSVSIGVGAVLVVDSDEYGYLQRSQAAVAGQQSIAPDE